MTTPELVQYIKNAKTQGQTTEQIKIGLVQNGWLASDVDEALLQINSSTFSSPMPSPVSAAPKSHKSMITAMVVLFVLLGGSASGYYYRNDLKTLPFINKFFPQEEISAAPDNPIEVAPEINNVNAVAPDTQTAVDCNAEIKARLPHTDFSKYVAIKGKVDFVNSNFPYSSMTAFSGVIDQSNVKEDGTFCVLRSTDVPAAMVAISSGEKDILFAMSSIGDAEDVLVVSPESTAIFFVDVSYSAYTSPEENNKIISLIKTLPEGKDYIQSVIKQINVAPVGFDANLLMDTMENKILAIHAAIKKTPSTPQTPNPIVDQKTQADAMAPLARDMKRIYTMQNLMGGLAAHRSIIGSYPQSFAELKAGGIAMVPQNITPNDGVCTAAQNNFTYTHAQDSYTVSFCLGQATFANGVQYTAGVHTLTPSGIK